MPNIARILKEEISRVARKEMRAGLDKTRQSVVRHQREIVALKNRVKALERQVSALGKALAKSGAASPAPARATPVRFVPKGLASTRKRLGLSAADLAGLVGVSSQTIYNWERGATKPGPEQQATLASLRGVGKRELRARLASQQG